MEDYSKVYIESGSDKQSIKIFASDAEHYFMNVINGSIDMSSDFSICVKLNDKNEFIITTKKIEDDNKKLVHQFEASNKIQIRVYWTELIIIDSYQNIK